MRLKHLIIAVTLAVCLPGIANAQELKRPLTESNLALEVTFSKGRPPAYQTAKGGAWYALFDRVAEWQLPAGDAPVKAVRVVPYVDRDVVRITVSVLRGVKFQDFEERVAAYRRHVDERITVDALKSFGVEPFEIKVVRVAPHVSDFPSILNHTRSVEVVGIEQLSQLFLFTSLPCTTCRKRISARSRSAFWSTARCRSMVCLKG